MPSLSVHAIGALSWSAKMLGPPPPPGHSPKGLQQARSRPRWQGAPTSSTEPNLPDNTVANGLLKAGFVEPQVEFREFKEVLGQEFCGKLGPKTSLGSVPLTMFPPRPCSEIFAELWGSGRLREGVGP